MPRNSGLLDFIKIRGAVDFPTVLAHYGLTPEGQGEQIKLHCPFHDDGTPSCSVNTERNIFKCFGCNASGNVLEFISMKEEFGDNSTFKAAQTALKIMGFNADDFRKGQGSSEPAQKAAKTAEKATAAPKAKPAPKTPENGTQDVSDAAECHTPNPSIEGKVDLVLTYEHPFLESRNISPEVAEQFGLGWAGAGIMKKRIAIPIHNLAGERVAYTGRWASDDPTTIPEKEGKYKLPKGFNKSLELFNIHRAAAIGKPYVVIVEGVWSAVRLHMAGVPCVAMLGTSLSDVQAELLVEAGFRHSILIMDGDDAGRAAQGAVLDVLCQHVYAKALVLAEGEKPDTMSSDMVESLIR